jgi:hypothetical protein
LLAEHAELFGELASSLGKSSSLVVESIGVFTESCDDVTDSGFELSAAANIGVQEAETEWPEWFDNLLVQYRERFACVTRDEDALAFCQQVPDKVGDGVSLSRARWPLYQDRSMLREALGDLELLGVGRLAEQDVVVLVGPGACEMLARLRLLWRLGNWRVRSHNAQEGLRQHVSIAVREILSDRFQRGHEAEVASALKDVRLT